MSKNIMRELRKKQGLTQAELAEQANLTPNGYAKIERNETEPQAESIKRIAQVLGVSMEMLMTKKDEGAKNIVIIGENANNTVDDNAVIGIKNINCDIDEYKEKIELYRQLIAEKDKRIMQLEEMIGLLKK